MYVALPVTLPPFFKSEKGVTALGANWQQIAGTLLEFFILAKSSEVAKPLHVLVSLLCLCCSGRHLLAAFCMCEWPIFYGEKLLLALTERMCFQESLALPGS